MVLRFNWDVDNMTGATFKCSDIIFDETYPEKARKKVLKVYNEFGF